MTQREQQVLEYINLRKGINNKVSMRNMADTLSISTRDLRECIEELVILGHPIGNIGGYFWIETQEELDRVKQLAEKRFKSSAKRWFKVRRLANINQLSIGEQYE